jgi:hypothetical protein
MVPSVTLHLARAASIMFRESRNTTRVAVGHTWGKRAPR